MSSRVLASRRRRETARLLSRPRDHQDPRERGRERAGGGGRISEVSGIGIAVERERGILSPRSRRNATRVREIAYKSVYKAPRNPRRARYVSAGLRKYDLSRGGFRVTLMFRFSPSLPLPSLYFSLSLCLSA